MADSAPSLGCVVAVSQCAQPPAAHHISFAVIARAYYGVAAQNRCKDLDPTFMTKKPLSSEELTGLTAGLHKLAPNLWWTWSQEAQEIFSELSPRGWQNLYHNAVAILHEVTDYELRVRLQDPDFAERVRRLLEAFDDYLNDAQTWGQQQ